MTRPRMTWLLFAVCLAVAMAAMGWTSLTVLRLERAEARAAAQAEFERLALWRMDSALVPLIAQESSRPHLDYSTGIQSEEAESPIPLPSGYPGIRVPSPLVEYESPYILLHFQIGPDGAISSPQVPTDDRRGPAGTNDAMRRRIETYRARLTELRRSPTEELLARALSPGGPFAGGAPQRPEPSRGPEFPPEFDGEMIAQSGQQQQAARSVVEFQRRMSNTAQINQQAVVPRKTQPSRSHVELGPMKPLWVGNRLILARRAQLNGEAFLQGCLLNWPAIRSRLVDEVRDLLPDAHLAPVETPGKASPQFLLASLPVELISGEAAVDPLPLWSPLRLSLAIAWGGLVLAAAAVAALLLAAVRLSERRGAFVSAVTHELRTPLTTFRMYTEMLAAGIVADEDKRQSYLQTLRTEAERLGHLVENVLSYARLDRTRRRAVCEPVALGDLLTRLEPSLSRMAEQAGMRLEVSVETESRMTVPADAAALERIVVNLVDNACKYAAAAEDRRIHLDCRAEGRHVVICVRDHGPGISPEAARRLFQPFAKSDRDAANSAPGVGLGLSLSRRLARGMGGELDFDATGGSGACFRLRLPLGA